MSDLWAEIQPTIDAFSKLSRLADIAQKKREAEKLLSKTCGHCQHWMKTSVCPREKPSMTGYSQGPNCNAPACSKFLRKGYLEPLYLERMDELTKRLEALEGGENA